MLETVFVGVWGALTVLNLAATAFLIAFVRRPGSPAQLQSAVRQLAIDVEELYGAVEKWTKRRYAAEARAKIGEPPVQSVPDRSDRAAYKQFLRSKQLGRAQ